MAKSRDSVRSLLYAPLALVTAAGSSLVPVSVAAVGVGVVAAAAVVHAQPARAATSTVLILSTSVNGGSSSAEAQAASAAGATVTVATPSAWDAMTTAQFKGYSALVVGDPSSGSTCASSVPSDALSSAAVWGAAVTGNVSVLGTAPALAGSAGQALLADGIKNAMAGSGTGLYVSLNCEYSTAPAGTAVPLLAGVDGGGFAVTGQGSSCPSNAGTINTWASVADPGFNGLTSNAIGSWPSPACSVQESFTAWPGGLGGLAYDQAAAPADFTASNGQSGQPYVLAGSVPSAGTLALAPSTGGEVPSGTLIGGSNPAEPGLAQASAGDPVSPENGDFSQSATDLSIPGFGPALTFSRTYDALLAQQQTVAGTPGRLGYGWTDNWATSLSLGRPAPGDIYTLAGLATNSMDGGLATSAPLNSEDGITWQGGNEYIADSARNRVQEVAGSTGTQWGIPMTAGDVYTIAGSAGGTSGTSPNGTAASASLLSDPETVAFDPAGNLFIADAGNDRVIEIPVSSGTSRGISMTANDVYTVAGSAAGSSGVSGDGGAATSAKLDDPAGIAFAPGTSDLYIADLMNNRVQEVPAENGSQWGKSMTAWRMYTVTGSATGVAGDSGNGTAAGSALLDFPQGISLASGNLYIADNQNDRIVELPSATGSQWGISMTANKIYTVAGSASGMIGASGDGGKATSALLYFPESVTVGNGQQLYIADSANNRIQEVARTSHTEFGMSMTANDIYTIAGDANGSSGFSGDGGAATSAHLNTPGQVALDSSSDLLIADTSNNRIRQVSAGTATINTVAGNGGTLANAGDGGPATTSSLSNPDTVATDPTGNVYIADTNNNRVQEIAATNHAQFGVQMTAGDVYTVAGSANGVQGIAGDGGPATSALLNGPIGVAADAAGNLYIADYGNDRVQEVAAGSGTQRGVSMTAGDIYTIAGNASGSQGNSGDGGPATSALLSFPMALAVDAAGDVYIADMNNNRVQEVAGTAGSQWGQSMTANDMYTVAGSSTSASGSTGDGGPASSALLSAPASVALDTSGDLYIADPGNNRIQEASAVTGTQRGVSMTAGDIYTIAGDANGSSGLTGDGGPATSALLNFPMGVAVDRSGNVFIGDGGNNRLQEVAEANGTQWGQSMTANDMYTIAGAVSGTVGDTGDGGPATSALLSSPNSIAVDPSGDVFLNDNADNRIRELSATAITALPQAPAGTGITVNQADGSQVTFYPTSGGNCSAPYEKAGGYCTLPQYAAASLTYNSGQGTYTYSPQPGTTYTYASTGALSSESDAAGNTLTLTYGSPAPGSGNCPSTAAACITITAATGRALTVGVNAADLVTSVTDPMGRQWSYGYTGSDLTSVKDPMGNVTTYVYGAGSTGNAALVNDLLTMTSPNAQPAGPDAGDSTVNVYNAAGQVTSQTDPMGFKTTFSYCVNAATGNCMNASTGTGNVTVDDPDGNTTVYSYSLGALTAESKWTGGTTLASEQDFVPNTTAGGTSGGTLLDTAAADGNGNVTTTTYDASGNALATTAPDGVGSQTATTTAQYTGLSQPACTSNAISASTCGSAAGPAPVAPGGALTPPSSAPPEGLSWTLYDTEGNELYTTTGVYEPGSASAAYSRTTYQLFKGNTVTLGGNQISCANMPPSASLPCATINANGVATQLQYDAHGDLISSAIPDGNPGNELATTTYTYDGDGEQTAKVAQDGNLAGANAANYTTATAYNADGQKASVTQAGGSGATVTPRQTVYGYDGNGNQVTVKDPLGNTTTTTFNADDQATIVKDPDGNQRLTCYDGNGNVAQTVPAVGVAANNLTSSSCPASYPAGFTARLATDATSYTVNALNQKTEMDTPLPAGQTGSPAYEKTTYAYDGNGNLVQTTAPPATNGGSNQVTTDTYTSTGRLASVTTGSASTPLSTISYCYDPNGDKTAEVYGDGDTPGTPTPCETSSPWVVSPSSYPTAASYQTTYSYDSLEETVSTTAPATSAAPNGATTSWTYDPAGNQLTSTDPNGVTTTWTVTPDSLPATETFSGSAAHSVGFTYDASGQRTGMTDATGTSSYVYDPFGEMTSATNGAGQVIGYGYDANRNVTSITYPLPATATWAASDTVNFGYNKENVLNSVTDFNGHEISITNNGDHQPTSETLGSTSDTVTTTYDNASTPSAIELKNSTTTLQSFTYSDSQAGTILSETDKPSSSQSPATYTYDSKGRITSMTPGSGATLNYSFDASSNLTTLPNGAATGGYDKAGELTSSTISGATTSYTYNADGERMSASQGGTTIASGTWNGAGQLTSYNDSAADMTAATYDGNGLRATATTSSGTQTFTWDTLSRIPALIMDSASAYIYAGRLVPAEQVNLATGAITYLVSDSLGSVRGTVSSSGALTGTTSYDAWGEAETTGGLTATTPFGYAGAYTDADGLIYLIKRYYEPATGQFISLDPQVSSTLAPYGYGGGNPVTGTDPTGQYTYIWYFQYEYWSNYSAWRVPPCLSCTPSWWINVYVDYYQNWDAITQVDQVFYRWVLVHYVYNNHYYLWKDIQDEYILAHIEMEYWMIGYHWWTYQMSFQYYVRTLYLM